jgi:hypothetical protein
MAPTARPHGDLSREDPMTFLRLRVLRPFVVAAAALLGVLAGTAPANADYLENYWYCNTGTFSFWGASHSCIKGTLAGGATQYGNPAADRQFIVGTDHQIWNIVHYETGYLSGWKSLGGWGQKGVWVVASNTPKNVTIRTVGSDGRNWCKKLTNGSWGLWYHC